MNRFVEVEIGEKKYPMIFNINAMKSVTEKFGSVEGALDNINAEQTQANGIEDIVFLLGVLIDQGVKAKHRLGHMDYEPISREDIELLVDINDIQEILPKIFNAKNISQLVDVGVKENPNAETVDESPSPTTGISPTGELSA
jgi:hypothetical protein